MPFDNFTLDYMAPKNGRKFQAVSLPRQQPGLLFRHSRRSHNRSECNLIAKQSKKGFENGVLDDFLLSAEEKARQIVEAKQQQDSQIMELMGIYGGEVKFRMGNLDEDCRAT